MSRTGEETHCSQGGGGACGGGADLGTLGAPRALRLPAEAHGTLSDTFQRGKQNNRHAQEPWRRSGSERSG
ncbi:hypothetical protein EYF80_028408 [Liparis tanakae]|uniref:Uncharacterized protein n=1 Tax=Liparis tanakae TaxID=230148 RepID=A0A4Z2H6Z8_9TELE|nr:hypothetical protein EYF80_028408 [Liparis tanakae]